MSWFALPSDGAARRVSGMGLVIGRAPTCDVILREPEVSRRHVLLQFGFGGQLDIVPLPGARTFVNGVALDKPVAAKHGDVLGFPGGAMIELTCEGGAADLPDLAWLFDVRGRRIGLRREPLDIGGGEDDIVIETWPAGAARLTWNDAGPLFEARVDGFTRNGLALARDTPIALAAGDQLSLEHGTVAIATASAAPDTTFRETRITRITLEMLPTGGMVTIATTRGEHTALLAERRFALVMCLLAPPAPYKPGEYVPDEVVLGAVWPRNDAANRGDLNQLAHRLRADLKAAGLVTHVIDRYAKGGATKFVLPDGVAIDTRT